LGASLAVGYLAVGEHWIVRGPFRARPAVIPLGLVLLWLAADFAPYVPRLHLEQINAALDGFWQQSWSWRHVMVTYGAWCLITECLRQMLRLSQALLGSLTLLGATIGARLVVISQHLAPQEIAAWAAVSVTVAITIGQRNETRMRLMAYAGLLALLANELLPWRLSSIAQEFSWVPFSGSLLGDRNYQPLLVKIFLYSALLWCLLIRSRNYWRTVSLLLLGVAAIEIAQIWMPNQRPELTDILLVATAGAAFWLLKRVQPYALGIDSMHHAGLA
jgi:hypothetical protein